MVKTLTAADILLAIEELISGGRTREEISSWAAELREAADAQSLSYSPKADEPRLWRAIVYLEGVDLKDSPLTYLHEKEDFVRFRWDVFGV